MDDIAKLKSFIEECENIVFFGGAGVSTESGIKDFRSKDGLYHETYTYSPEEILSHHFFEEKPVDFYQFYRDKMNCLDAKPNLVHEYLTELEKQGKLTAVITQNIDGLHTKAKTKNVYELHGSIYRNYCTSCHKFYEAKDVFTNTPLPTCTCGGLIKPDVVLYEEPLDEEVIQKSIDAILHADLLLVAGTSLLVYPASSFIRYFKGKYLVIINREKTPADGFATLVIHDTLGNVFRKIM